MISIANNTGYPLDLKHFETIIKKVLEEEGREMEISLVFVSPKVIKRLNKEYRKKNKVTDVLSFYYGKEKGKDYGEIVVCPKRVKKQARRLKIDFEEELERVVIHGLLHLLGYDHERNEKEAQLMQEKQEFYLAKFKNKKTK